MVNPELELAVLILGRAMARLKTAQAQVINLLDEQNVWQERVRLIVGRVKEV